MPSDRRQFNVRMNEETAAKVDRLLPIVARAVGIELSQGQFFALAVAALEEKHRDEVNAPEPEPQKPRRGKK